jgi:hypothetical protein
MRKNKGWYQECINIYRLDADSGPERGSTMESILTAVLIDALVMLISIASALGIGAIVLASMRTFVNLNNSDQSIAERDPHQRIAL